MNIDVMKPEYLPDTSKTYAQGMIVTGTNPKWIILAGQAALDTERRIIAPYDMGAQADFIFANIIKMLNDAGATINDCVKLNMFITDMSRYKEVASARDKYFAGSTRMPTSLVCGVNELVYPGLMLEVEVTAVI